MQIEGRIAANAAILGVGEAVAQFSNLLLTVLLAQRYGPELLGHYSLSLAIGALGAVFVSLGVHGILTREIGHDASRGQARIGEWLPAQALTAVIVWSTIAAVAALLDLDPPLMTVLLVVSAYQIVWRAAGIFSLQFSARGRMIVPAMAEALHRIAILAAAGAAISLDASPEAVLVSLPVVALIAAGGLAGKSFRAFGIPKLRFDTAAIGKLLSRAAPFLTLAILAAVELRIGIVLLAAVAGSEATGIYMAADRLMLPVLLVQGLVIRAAYPAMLRLWTTDRTRLELVASRSLRFMLLCSIPLSTLTFNARELAPMVFGPRFGDSIAVLAVLAWLPVLAGLKYLWQAQALAANLERVMTAATTMTVVLMIGIALFATPARGAVGLAIAVIMSQLLHVSLLYWALARQRMRPQLLPAVRGPLCAAGCALAASAVTSDYGLAVSTGAGIVATGLGLWLFGGIRRDDWRHAIALFRRK